MAVWRRCRRAVNHDRLNFRIDDPDERNAGRQVFFHFLGHFRGEIIWRNDFNSQIGGDGKEAVLPIASLGSVLS